MKKLLTICAVCVMVLVLSNLAEATTMNWEIMDAGLQDTANFVQQENYGGTLNSRTNIPGDPGTKFNITLQMTSGWAKVQIGDGYNFPTPKAGLVAATGNGSLGNTGFGDLTAYDGYTMTLTNIGDYSFAAVLYMNTGWTDNNRQPIPPELDRYYQDTKDWTWLAPGDTKTLTLDFLNAWLCSENYVWNPVSGQSVLNLNHISNIGFQIGSNMGQEMPPGTTFDVVVPEPATIALLCLGSLSLIRRKR